ncbi:tetrathionate reductase subunit B [Burkholderiales bacterium]|nr:MAG: 4Fe-4S dicluster domain-containing protein [Burkholderiales bacterium]CAG0951824.1 tetrathionate reductase subunit B [Burkholderiales bacterium]
MSFTQGGDSTDGSEAVTAPISRRRLVTAGLSALAAALLPGWVLIEHAGAQTPAAGANPKRRWGLLIDTTRCTASCEACVTACQRENGLAAPKRPTDAQWIRKLTVTDRASGRQRQVPMMCQHCANPPCVDVCPTGASFRRADGIVLVDRHRCIGCRYCMMACPYQARSFVHEALHDQKPEVPRGKGTVEACSLCVHRLDRGGQPACVEACAAQGQGAMLFGDLNDKDSAISKRLAEVSVTRVRADLGLDPGVAYQGI